MIALVVLPAKTYAQSIVAGLPFGGIVIGPVLSTIIFPACPPHILVVKLSKEPLTQPVFLGIIPGPTSRIYRNYDLVTPGVWLLGTYSPIIILPPVCPYPVSKLLKAGTGLLP